MNSSSSHSPLIRLIAVQAQVMFADNAGKLALIGLLQFPGILSGDRVLMLVSILAALLVLPFLAFSPLAGWTADRFPKQQVLRFALLSQILALGIITGALMLGSISGAVVGFGLLALQSAFFSPARQGLLKEVAGSQIVASAAGWMALFAIAAIFAGTWFGGRIFDATTRWTGDAPGGAMLTFGILTAAAVIAFFIWTPRGAATRARTNEPFNLSILFRHGGILRQLWNYRTLRFPALASAYFYGIGGLLYLTVVQTAGLMHSGATGSSTQAGRFILLLGAGVALGNGLFALASRRAPQIGWIPAGLMGVAGGLIGCAIATPGGWLFAGSLLFTGLSAGLFIAPVEALLQSVPADSERGRVLAAGNLIVHGAGFAGIVFFWLMADLLQLSPAAQFIALFGLTLSVAAFALKTYAAEFFRCMISPIARLILKIRIRDAHNIPTTNGVLFLANHLSYADAVILQAALPRKVCFLGANKLRSSRFLSWCFSIFGVLPVSPENPRSAIREAVKALSRGEWVCLFPEGGISQTGTLHPLQKGFELIAAKSGADIVPVHIDGVWGTIFGSGAGNRRAWRTPGASCVQIRFGTMIETEDASRETVRQALLDLGEANFRERGGLKRSLGSEITRSLKRAPWKPAITDLLNGRRVVSRAAFLGLSLALARHLRKTASNESRIAIALPPGIGAAAANLACTLCDKTPVNLNFTAGRESLDSAIAQSGVRTLLTAPLLLKKYGDDLKIENRIDISTTLKAIGRSRIVIWMALGILLPGTLLARLCGFRRRGDDEATLLFTSGSSGLPKGVPLTHANLLANLHQAGSTSLLQSDDRVLACLPFFHSFGLTVTFWLPLLRGLPIVTSPVATDARAVVKAVSQEKVTILAGTALFLRLYADRVEDGDFASLRVAIAGAEKLPAALADRYREQFNLAILEGYGLTETAPAVALNFADTTPEQGTVGPLLPGISARIENPDTGNAAAPGEAGLLFLRGPNIFNGYLHEQTADDRENLANGWLATGDIARFDAAGRIHIEGRLSRFSKIAGEMVPHGTVEGAIATLFSQRFASTAKISEPICVVMGLPDEQRGEKLVLLTTCNAGMKEIRAAIAASDLPRLWLPREIVVIDKIPVLGSGKLDLKNCQKCLTERMSQAA